MKGLYVTSAVLAAVILGGGFWWMSQGDDRARPTVSAAMHGAGAAAPAPDPDDIVVPELSDVAQAGEQAFEQYCARCHGENAAGTDQGPPLVHRIYEPNHHADLAFLLAARQGVRSHHWRFGDMPPVQGVGEQEVEDIVAYVRALQRANGIR